MSGVDRLERIRPQLFLHVLLAWLAAAVVFLLLFSLVISRFATSSRVMAYFSSALSFLAAAAAGSAAARGRLQGRIVVGLLTGALLTLALCALGLLIRRGTLSSDGAISLVSFTMAGALFGSVFLTPRERKSRGKSRFSASRNRTKKNP